MSLPRPPLPALEPESERFWRACREGWLEISRCRGCGWYVHPPRPVCPRCHGRDLGWERTSGTGTVVSYTVNHQRWIPTMEVPYVIALVELAEQAGLRLTTNLVGCAPDDVRIGMPVRVRFEPVSDAIALPLGWRGSGGEGPRQVARVMLSALAVAGGLCRHVLVYRTVTEATAQGAGGRVGIGAGSRAVSGFAQWVIPFGAMSAANWLALHAVRHMHEFGTKREHLGEIALAGRAHAALNPAAIYREPLTMEEYLAARIITWPFGLYDCDVPVDGSTAVIVSAADVGRDLPRPPVRI